MKGKPKITITRVPTIDQTEMGFLYPLDNVTTHESWSPPSTPDDQNICCGGSFTIPEKANIVTDKIEEDVSPILVGFTAFSFFRFSLK